MPKPKIAHRPPLTVAVVEGAGNPTSEVPRLAPALYKSVYGSKKLHGPSFKPAGKLRGRYFYDSPDVPDEQKRFKLALPVPDGTTELVQALPDVAAVTIEVWPEETAAEIVHVGPYATETETLEQLFAYLRREGYAVAGPHEEEYLSGPQTPEAKRRTILRYGVRRRNDE